MLKDLISALKHKLVKSFLGRIQGKFLAVISDFFAIFKEEYSFQSIGFKSH